MQLTPARIDSFQRFILSQGDRLYRDLPWRNTRDAYGIWISEVMLQQTQVSRGIRYWQRWVERFPTVDALAAASLPDVLEAWQGLGYNRRALMLKRSAEMVSERFGGVLPKDGEQLLALPGVGPSTAAGIRIFAFDIPDMYLETNVRAVFLHELLTDRDEVPDREIVPLVEATCLASDPRRWYYALLDYGAYLKSAFPNPSRRSKSHSRQSAFEGSHRQKRAWLLRAVMASDDTGEMDATGRGDVPSGGRGATLAMLADGLRAAELAAGREPVDDESVAAILDELIGEGFITRMDGVYRLGG